MKSQSSRRRGRNTGRIQNFVPGGGGKGKITKTTPLRLRTAHLRKKEALTRRAENGPQPHLLLPQLAKNTEQQATCKSVTLRASTELKSEQLLGVGNFISPMPP